jgi:hypothetical protein
MSASRNTNSHARQRRQIVRLITTLEPRSPISASTITVKIQQEKREKREQ